MRIIREILRYPAERSRGRHTTRSIKRKYLSDFPIKKRKRNVSRASSTYDYDQSIHIFPK
jgi:hypothetical protein